MPVGSPVSEEGGAEIVDQNWPEENPSLNVVFSHNGPLGPGGP